MEESSMITENCHNDDSPTLYVRNLGDKLGRASRFRRHAILHDIFSRYGTILKIYSRRSLSLRGQAWVVFDTVEEASEAKKKLDGYKLTGRKLEIFYAKKVSDIISKRYGHKEEKVSRRAKHPRKANKNLKKRIKRKMKAQVGIKMDTDASGLQDYAPPLPPLPSHMVVDNQTHFLNPHINQVEKVREEGKISIESTTVSVSTHPTPNLPSFEPPRPPILPAIVQQQQQQQPFPASLPVPLPIPPPPPPPPPPETIPSMDSQTTQRQSNLSLPPPSNILLASNLPVEATHESLMNTFQKYNGFVEVRPILSKRLAFIEYIDEREAGIALIEEKKRVEYDLTYAKK